MQKTNRILCAMLVLSLSGVPVSCIAEMSVVETPVSTNLNAIYRAVTLCQNDHKQSLKLTQDLTNPDRSSVSQADYVACVKAIKEEDQKLTATIVAKEEAISTTSDEDAKKTLETELEEARKRKEVTSKLLADLFPKAVVTPEVTTPVATPKADEAPAATTQEVEAPAVTTNEVITPATITQEDAAPAVTEEVVAPAATTHEVVAPVATTHENVTPTVTEDVVAPVVTEDVTTPAATDVNQQ